MAAMTVLKYKHITNIYKPRKNKTERSEAFSALFAEPSLDCHPIPWWPKTVDTPRPKFLQRGSLCSEWNYSGYLGLFIRHPFSVMFSCVFYPVLCRVHTFAFKRCSKESDRHLNLETFAFLLAFQIESCPGSKTWGGFQRQTQNFISKNDGRDNKW